MRAMVLSTRLRFDISPGRRFTGRIEVAAELRAGRLLFFRPRLEPTDPVVPPTTWLFVRTRQPRRWVFASIGRHPVASLVLRSGIDYARNMSARSKHEANFAAE